MRLAVVIPAYNEGEHIRRVVEKSSKYASVIVVDDGSTDSTALEAAKGGGKILRNEVNRGKWAALKLGFNHVLRKRWEIDAIIQLDGDGQHDPDEIPKFTQALNSGFDVVLGQRQLNPAKMPLIRIISNLLSTLIIMLIFWIWIQDTQSGYRAYRKEAIKRLILRMESIGFEGDTEILYRIKRQGLRIGKVAVHTSYGEEKSKINPFRDIKRFISAVVNIRFKGSTGTLYV